MSRAQSSSRGTRARLGESPLGRRPYRRQVNTQLFVHPLQASAEHLAASNVADAVQTLASTDMLHHTASTLYQHLAGDGLQHLEEAQLLQQLADGSMQDVAIALQGTSATALDAFQAGVADAYSNSVPLASSTSSIIGELATALDAKLAYVQHLDPDSTKVLSESMSLITDALNEALEAGSSRVAEQTTQGIAAYLQNLNFQLKEADSASAIMHALHSFVPPMGNGSQEQISTQAVLTLAITVIALIMAGVPSADDVQAEDDANVPRVYDPNELKAYFAARPVAILKRQAEVASKLSVFVSTLLADWHLGAWEPNMPKRAKWLREIFESLGPAYIKIAQALSTRVDLLPEAYLKEFAQLQDNVPPFETKEALQLIESEFGMQLDQVYKATLTSRLGGGEVAVKVQRPGILHSVALDTLLMRQATEIVSSVPMYDGGWADVLDDWAGRFFQEMDYQQEAVNMITFKRHMAEIESIVVPDVHPQLTTQRVIVTSWVDGVKLSACKSEDVLELCDALLNCYLHQLMGTGFLHADPHPGNLLRTADGKLCILDFGLVSEVSEDKRVHLVEYITHLSLEDWDAVTQDLVKLDFLPADMSDEQLSVISPVIKDVMGQLVIGGTAGISIGSLSIQLEGVARQYKMVVPPYFALVLRAFSVIEGIAMQHNGNYRIVGSCFPYLSQRLLTDDHPRMQDALKKLLCGDSERLDVPRLRMLLTAFSAYTMDARSNASPGAMQRHGRSSTGIWGEAVVDKGKKQVLKAVFARRGTFVQKLIVEEMVAATSALTREALCEAFKIVFASNAAVTALRNMEALGPLRALLAPIPTPLGFLSDVGSRVSLTNEDRRALNTVSLLLDMLGDNGHTPAQHNASSVQRPSVSLLEMIDDIHRTITTGGTLVRGAGELVPIVPEILPGVQYSIESFVSQLLRKLALRLADDLDPGNFDPRAKEQFLKSQQVTGATSLWAGPESKGETDSWKNLL